MALKGNDIKSTTSTTNVDKKISIGGNGSVQALQDSAITLNGGGAFNVTSSDPEVAKAAIAASTQAVQTAAKSADAVVKSQEQFVATASGQKYIVYIVGAVAGVAILGAGFIALKTGKK